MSGIEFNIETDEIELSKTSFDVYIGVNNAMLRNAVYLFIFSYLAAQRQAKLLNTGKQVFIDVSRTKFVNELSGTHGFVFLIDELTYFEREQKCVSI